MEKDQNLDKSSGDVKFQSPTSLQVGLLTEDLTGMETNFESNTLSAKAQTAYQIDSKLNQLSFFAFGVSLLLPWNAIIAAMDYFNAIYPNHQPSFTFLVAVSVPMLLMQIVCFLLRGQISLHISLTMALAVNTVLTLLTAIIPQVIDDEDTSYAIMMVMTFIFGSMIAFLQTSCYGVAGVSMKLTTMLMVGVGISSISMNVLRMIFLALVSNYAAGQIVFFSISGAYLFACFFLSILFLRDYDNYQKQQYHESLINNSEIRQGSLVASTKSQNRKNMLLKAWQVYKINYPYGLSVVLTFAIYYTFFPGVMLKKKLDFIDSFAWFANGIITLHNVCDTIGRTLAGRWIIVNKKNYPYVCLIRLIFVITYCFFFFGVAPQFFQNDAWVIIQVILFSLSCGYLASLGMYYGSDKECGDQGLGGAIMSFNLTLGICLGSVFAIACFS
eukprot:403332207